MEKFDLCENSNLNSKKYTTLGKNYVPEFCQDKSYQGGTKNYLVLKIHTNYIQICMRTNDHQNKEKKTPHAKYTFIFYTLVQKLPHSYSTHSVHFIKPEPWSLRVISKIRKS